MSAFDADRAGLLAAPAPSGDWLVDFYPYTWNHVLSSGFFLGIIAVLICIGLNWRDTPRERKLRLAWGIFAFITQAVELYWWCRPGFYRAHISLPIHVCDIAAWIAVFSLLTDVRLFRTLLFYIGLFLSSLAFFTPVIGAGEGIATYRFWSFFISHSHIVGVGLYHVIVLKYRPTWRDFAIVAGLGINYVVVVSFLNAWLHNDANYGFLGRREAQPGVVLLLGPYPMRIVWMSIIVLAVFATVTALFQFRSKTRPVQPS